MIPLSIPLTLASNSPRRQQLLHELGFHFEVEVRPTDEQFPTNIPTTDVAGFLAQQKAAQFQADLSNRLVLCADTIVIIGHEILNKPANEMEAKAMLQKLSGRTHEVVTGICLLGESGFQTLHDIAKVTFNPLTDSEIEYYIAHYQPFDKAGGYGIQEWIGMMGISRIEGSFYTIMGLPLHLVYQLLSPYIRL
ncbi:MAG: Maf family protein [Spirosomataceae bacterium]